MSNIKIDLDSVRVTDGQGAGEGAFELNIQVLEYLSNGTTVSKLNWPSQGNTTKVSSDGKTKSIGEEVETYSVNSPVTKRFKVVATEEDSGTLGQDETGHADVTFNLVPSTITNPQPTTIRLQNQHGNEGSIEVTLTAKRI